MKAMVIFIEKKQKYIFLKKPNDQKQKQTKKTTEKFEFLPFSFTYLVNGL